MRTRDELISFVEQYNPDFKLILATKNGALVRTSFDRIEESIEENEHVLFCVFVGPCWRRNRNNKSTVLDFTVLAITDKRLLISGKISSVFAKQSYCDSHSISSISSISIKSESFGISTIRIETLGDDDVEFNYDKKLTQKVVNSLNSALNQVRNELNTSPSQVHSAADEIKKYKELLDIGAITQEEFDAKKKQLLGL